MRIKKGFMLRKIAGQWVVVPLGARVVEFNGIMTLSESGALLWEKMENGAGAEELVEAMLNEYDVDEATVKDDIREFIEMASSKGLLE